MSVHDPARYDLVRLLAETSRGPRREGLYALWLTVRVTQDLLLDPPDPERAHRRRVAALEHRLATLTLPPPLRRALATALLQLRTPRREAAAEILSLLVAPVRDAVGPDAAGIIDRAAGAARLEAPAHG